MSEYKVDLNNFEEEPPTPWTDEQYRAAFQSLVTKYHKMKTERDQYKSDVLAYAVACRNRDLENERLIRRNQKLEAYVRMWDKVKDLRKELLEITPNHQLLIGLGLYMNELERDMYKGRE